MASAKPCTVRLFFLYAVLDTFDVAAAQAFDFAAQFKIVLDFGIVQDAEAVDHGQRCSAPLYRVSPTSSR